MKKTIRMKFHLGSRRRREMTEGVLRSYQVIISQPHRNICGIIERRLKKDLRLIRDLDYITTSNPLGLEKLVYSGTPRRQLLITGINGGTGPIHSEIARLRAQNPELLVVSLSPRLPSVAFTPYEIIRAINENDRWSAEVVRAITDFLENRSIETSLGRRDSYIS